MVFTAGRQLQSLGITAAADGLQALDDQMSDELIVIHN